MNRKGKLSLLIAVTLLLQIALTGWTINPQHVSAAKGGPLVISLSPADDLSNVSITTNLKMTFDEMVAKGPSSAFISIYEYKTSALVESIAATSSRVSIDSSKRNVTITPSSANSSSPLLLGTDYYVLVDEGAFVNVSDGAGYKGIYSANEWNFRTEQNVDKEQPKYTGMQPVNAVPPLTSSIPITTPITISFHENVYAVSGSIELKSSQDTRSFAVTSSSVTGSGTSSITIKPPFALQPETTYTVTVPRNVFQDSSGNMNTALTWSFITDKAPLNAIAPFVPADNATSVDVNSDLQITFDQIVQKNDVSNKYIEIRKVSNNSTFLKLPANSKQIIVNGNTVTIKATTTSNTFEANTGYYVLIDPGVFTQVAPNGSEWFQGISDANVWNFTTDPGNEKIPPKISKFLPAHKGITGSLNTKLELTFDEPVYPSNGTIEIRNASNGSTFRTISVTSERVTGGGTSVITIDANKDTKTEAAKPFVNNTKYYVTIGKNSFRDAAGNYFAGLSSDTQYYFTVTQDGVAPTLSLVSPINNASAVAIDAELSATFSEAIMTTGSGAITIYRSGTGTGSSSFNTTFTVDPLNNKRLIIKPVNGLPLQRSTSYYVFIDDNAITDLSGNPYVGIQNEYQWTFKTIGTDTAAPVVSKLESSGSTIILTYNEELNPNVKPAPGSFYITVNGAQRSVSSVQVIDKTVVLTLTSAIINGQIVKLSYTKATPGLIQDLSLNEAASISNRDVAFATDTTVPKLLSGTATGNTITLSFSKDMIKPSSYAYTQFLVRVGSSSYYANSITSSGSLVYITINATIAANETVRVSYTPASYPLRDLSGNSVAAFTNYSLTNGTDSRAPRLESISANGNKITLQYDESLNPQSKPSTGQYSVLVNNAARSVSSVAITGDLVILTLSSAISSGQTVKVSYSGNSSTLMDLSGNAATSFSSQTAELGASSGSLVGAIAKGTKVTLTFTEVLNSNYVPSSINFLVKINNVSNSVSQVSVSGTKVTLTLSTSPGVGDAMTVTYYSASSGLRTAGGVTIDSFTNINIANQTTLSDILSGDYEVVDGGIGLTTTAATRTSDISPAGVYANRYTLLADKVNSAFQTARSVGVSSPRVVFTVPSTEGAAIVAVPLSTLSNANSSNKKSTFIVQFGDVGYEIPLDALDYTAIASSLNAGGSTGHLLIEIDQGTSLRTSALTSALNSSGGQIIAGPFHFETSAISGSYEKPITNFKGYVTRTIQTYSTLDASQTAVVWYDPVAGGLSYAPTQMTNTSGRTNVSFQRKGNSAYALVRRTTSYTDVGTHWAAGTINTLTRKYIIEGRTASKFEPSVSITRGEFATYIAKGLGLSGDKTAAGKFKDVNIASAMGAYIGAASAAGIVLGNTDGTFKPNNPITRQEMAVMMIRAAQVANVTVTLPQATSVYLNKFTDRSKVGTWAQADVAKAIYIGIISGKTTTTISPLTNATRAEGVIMIERMLKHVKFL